MIWAQLGVITIERGLFPECVGLAEVSKWEDLYFAFHSPASIKACSLFGALLFKRKQWIDIPKHFYLVEMARYRTRGFKTGRGFAMSP